MALAQARYCPCGTRLARDNMGELCAACLRKRQTTAVVAPPTVPADFWAHERMAEALEAWHMGHVFYAYRTHPWHGRPLSQETLSGWLGLTQAQLSRIESARTPPQDLGKLMSWAHSLRIPGDLLWFKLPGTQSATVTREHQAPERSTIDGVLPVLINGRTVFVPVDGETLARSGLGGTVESPMASNDAIGGQPSATEHEVMSPFNRRALLKGGLVAAALPGLGLEEFQRVAVTLADARRHFDGPTVDYLRRQLDEAKQDDGDRGPRKTLPVVLGLLGVIEQHAREVQPTVRRDVLSVGADGAEFVGWLYRDLHQPAAARFWYDRAMEWAQEADDTSMQGYVLLKKSQMAYDEGDAVRVLTLAQAAGHDRWRLPLRVRAEVTQQEALGAALVGEPLAVVQERLDLASQFMSEARDEPSTVGAYFNEHTLLLRNAISYTEAGKPSMAVDLFNDAMRTGTLSVRDGGLFNARRAAALALCGEPDEAARLGREAAEVARAMKSERTRKVLSEVLHTLSRWGGRPAVREFGEALRAS